MGVKKRPPNSSSEPASLGAAKKPRKVAAKGRSLAKEQLPLNALDGNLKLQALVAVLRKALDPASLQWVFGVVMTLAVSSYAKAQQDLQENEALNQDLADEGGSSRSGSSQSAKKPALADILGAALSADEPPEVLANPALAASPEATLAAVSAALAKAQGGFQAANISALKNQIDLIVHGPKGHAQVPLDVQILLAEVANAPVSDSLSLLQEINQRLQQWF